MLHLIPAPLHRVLYRVAHAVRLQWWRVRRPRHSSAVVIAFDERGRVLLVRHSYGPTTWTAPGGGANRREDPARAAVREIGEELGCGLADLAEIEASEERTAGAHDTQHVFIARLVGTPKPDMREIVAVTLADPGDLPEPCGRRTRGWVARAAQFRSQQR